MLKSLNSKGNNLVNLPSPYQKRKLSYNKSWAEHQRKSLTYHLLLQTEIPEEVHTLPLTHPHNGLDYWAVLPGLLADTSIFMTKLHKYWAVLLKLRKVQI